MPKKYQFHNIVRIALENDGWTVTHDPLRLEWQGVVYMPDLAAERVLAAERGEEKIAVEIKTFLGQIFQHEFYETLVYNTENQTIALWIK